MTITHSTVATLADEAGKEINKAEWNADHVVGDNTLVAAKLSATAATVFGATAAGAAIEKPLTGSGAVVLATAPTVTGEVLAAGSTTVAPLTFTSGTNLTTAAAGAAEYDGTVHYLTPVASNRAVNAAVHFICQNANWTGGDVNTAQPMFNETANGAVTLPASTSYEFEIVFVCTRAAGTTSHTTSTLFGGTATFTSIMYQSVTGTATGTVTSAARIGHATSAAAYSSADAASTSATENLRIHLRGVMRINGAGTVIPQFQYSAAPGGVPTILANSFFRLTPLGTNTVGSVGNWS